MSNNKIILNGCIQQFKDSNELTINDSEIFELFALTQITKQQELTFEELENSIVDGGNDGGIDSIIVLVNDAYIESSEDLEDIRFTNNTRVEIHICLLYTSPSPRDRG